MVCFVLDAIDTTAQALRFGVPGDEYSDIILLFACCVMICIDLYYVAWLYYTNTKLPEAMQTYTTGAFLGFGNRFKTQVDSKLVTVKEKMKKGKAAAGKGLKKAAGFTKAKRNRS